MAPILALIAYFSVDYIVSEVPHKLKEGGYYTLLVKPNCRWDSGHCTLVNKDVKLNLSTYQQDNKTFLLLSSLVELNSVNFSIVKTPETDNSTPVLMQTDNGYQFYTDLPYGFSNNFLQLIVAIEKSIFYTVAPLRFGAKEPDNSAKYF